MRGHAPVHKSEIEEQVAPSTTLGDAGSVDAAPTGSLNSSPKVIAAPLPAPSPTPSEAAKAPEATPVAAGREARRKL